MDSNASSDRASDSPCPCAPTVSNTALVTPAITPRQPDLAEQLRTIATTAAGFTELLDALRTHYPTAGLDGPDPVAAALDQAAAAANDLRSSVEAAANTIGRRAPEDQQGGPRPDKPDAAQGKDHP